MVDLVVDGHLVEQHVGSRERHREVDIKKPARWPVFSLVVRFFSNRMHEDNSVKDAGTKAGYFFNSTKNHPYENCSRCKKKSNGSEKNGC